VFESAANGKVWPALWALVFSIAFAGRGNAQVLADPLRPPASAMVASDSAAAGMPVLSMIVLRADRSHVVLDGTVRRVGERFGGYRLAQIGPTQVTLVSDDGQSLSVSLLPLAAVKPLSDKKP